MYVPYIYEWYMISEYCSKEYSPRFDSVSPRSRRVFEPAPQIASAQSSAHKQIGVPNPQVFPITTMNLSSDLAPTPLTSQETLSFEDIAPLLRINSCSGKTLFHDDDANCHEKTSDIVPTNVDILLGRDKVSYSHVGNKRFRVVVAMNRERYQSCGSREAKSKITAEVIQSIRECNGRFLKLNPKTKTYEEVGNDVAHEKVSHALRSAKDPKTKAPRKKRKQIAPKPPTPQENKTFEFMFREQQKIFQQMLGEQVQTFAEPAWQSSEVVAVGV